MKNPTECAEQIGFCNWLREQEIPFYHIPNGGRRSPQEAAKFKRMGVSPGVPDICIPVPSGGFHGLYIEMKRKKGGKLSDCQKGWFEILNLQGYKVYEAKGSDEAKNLTYNYLSVKDEKYLEHKNNYVKKVNNEIERDILLCILATIVFITVIIYKQEIFIEFFKKILC